MILGQNGIEQRCPVFFLLGKAELVHIFIWRQIPNRNAEEALGDRGGIGEAVVHQAFDCVFIHGIEVLFILNRANGHDPVFIYVAEILSDSVIIVQWFSIRPEGVEYAVHQTE